MAQLALGGFRPVFDFGEQRRFNPNSPVRDLLGVGLAFADQRLEPVLQILGGYLIEAVVDLARIDQLFVLEPTDI